MALIKWFILISLFPTLVFALDECGEGSQDSKELHWETLSQVRLHAKVINISGLLCAGSLPGQSELVQVNYRDDQGSKKNLLVKDLMTSRQILISDEDLNLGIIKDGPIMSLKIDRMEKAAELKYNVTLRFLRNLSKMSKGRDHRQVDFFVVRPANSDELITTVNGKDPVEFNRFDLYISLGLNIHKVTFMDFEQMRLDVDTKNLVQVDEL